VPRKMKESIGTDVLKKAAIKGVPSKVEITIKPPSPFDFVQLKAVWEKKEGRELSEEEFRQRLIEYINRQQSKMKESKLRYPKDTRVV